MLKLETLLSLCLESVILLIADGLMEGAVMWMMRVIEMLDVLPGRLSWNVQINGLFHWLRRLKSKGLILHRCGRAQ